jgi:penicillin-binding protein 1A
MTLMRFGTTPVTPARAFRTGLVIGLLAVCLAAGSAVGVFLYFRKTLPSLSHLESIAPPVKTVIYDRNGTPISELFQENRVIIPLEEVPKDLVNAFLATEDRRFRTHWGVSLIDNLRAAWVDIRTGKTAQGGSTITQQLARNLFLTHEKRLTRKIREALLAIEIEKRYTKDEILEMYLNQIYFGHGAYGVEAAARLYFDKSARSLSLSECAVLAGIPKNPGGYSPIRHPAASMERARVILDLMAEAGAITRDEAERARNELRPTPDRRGRVREAPYFVEYVRQELLAKFPPELLYGGGLRIETSLDLELQRAAEKILEEHLSTLERQRKYAHRLGSETDEESSESRAAAGNETPYIQGSVLALDPKTGEIRVMIGGRDFGDSHFNRAVQARRQPGSAFKVFVYTAAVDRGMTPADICQDAPLVIPIAGHEDYIPQNIDGEFRGPMTVRDALKKSINIPAIRTLMWLTPEVVVEYARRLGVKSDMRPVPSLALGSSEVTLLELTSAFAVFPNQGIRSEPFGILRVLDREGHVLEESRPRRHEALSPQSAYIMTSLLESVVNEGTAARVRAKGFKGSAAGKTGTPNDYTDNWFVGFTPEIVCGVWVGFDKKETIGEDQTGSRTALPIWIDFMTAAGRTEDPPFERPEGIVEREICTESGGLANSGCTQTRMEIFIAGHTPPTHCGLHGGRHRDAAVQMDDELRMAAGAAGAAGAIRSP